MRNPIKWAVWPLLLLASRLMAQNTSHIQQAAESLLIGPGDLVQVQVFQTPDLNEAARVTDAGELPLILGGNVKVSGLTPEQAAHAIEDTLKQGHYLLNPRVIVTVQQFATQSVSVLGEVNHPGIYPIVTPISILDVVAMAGGLTEIADRELQIQRHGSSETKSYVLSNLLSDAVETVVKVDPGDKVLVPRAGIVYALGDFTHAGGYVMDTNDNKVTLLQLVAKAGGMPSSATPSRAKLIRKSGDGYVEIPLRLNKIQDGKQSDFALKPNDIVYVPFSYLRNFETNAAAIVGTVGGAAIYRF